MRTRAASGCLLALVALVVLAACGATEPTPAPSCTIEGGADGSQTLVCTDGTRIPVGGGSCSVAARPEGGAVITCPDGTVTTIAPSPGASCSATLEPDGTAIVRCSDGTEARIPPGPDGASCTVAPLPEGGSVLRCGDGTEVVLSGGGSCTARDNGDGTITIACTDGTEVTISDGSDGTSCSVAAEPDGTYTVSCTDGTAARIWPGGAGAGAIEGHALLPGTGDHAGITVRVDELDVAASTDAAGAYRLDGVPAGMHALVFEHPGHAPARLDGVPVLPGTYRPRDVTLHGGARVAIGDTVPVALSPDGAEALFVRPASRYWTAGTLHHVDIPTGRETRVGDAVRQAELAAGRGRVVFLTAGDALWIADVAAGSSSRVGDRVTGGFILDRASGSVWAVVDRVTDTGEASNRGTLVHVDAASASRTTIAADVPSGFVWPLPSLAAALYLRRTAPGVGTLELWDASSGSASAIGEEVPADGLLKSPGGAVVAGSRLASDGARELFAVDLRTGAVTAGGGTTSGPMLFDPTGRWLAYGAGEEVALWDLAAGSVASTAGGRPIAIDRTGRSVLLLGGGGTELELWETATGIVTLLASMAYRDFYTGPPDPFSADGEWVAYNSGSIPGEFVVREIATANELSLGSVGTLQPSPFSPAGDRLISLGAGDGRGGDLLAFDFPGATPTLIATEVGWYELPAYTPDGSALLFRRFQSSASRGDLHLWEFATGRGIELGTAVAPNPRLLSGGAGVLYFADALEGAGTLRHYDRASGRAVVLDDSVRLETILVGGLLLYSSKAIWPSDETEDGLYLAELR